MPSKNRQNSSDGRLTQGRNWRQIAVHTYWPAPGARLGALRWALLPSGSLQRKRRSKPVGDVSCPGKVTEQKAQSLLILSLLQSKSTAQADPSSPPPPAPATMRGLQGTSAFLP